MKTFFRIGAPLLLLNGMIHISQGKYIWAMVDAFNVVLWAYWGWRA